MKLAILGTGPMAMELALYFHLEGAMVKMIGPQAPGGKIKRMAENILSKDRVCERMELSPWGREFTTFNTEDLEAITYEDIWNQYYKKIAAFLSSERVFVPRELIRVQKQFLHPEEEIENRSRLVDLFRVTYGLNASGLVEEQLAENPELAEKIGSEILESLKNQVESFEDFDLVVDARGPFQTPHRMGAGYDYALNEAALSELGMIYYGHEFPVEKIEKEYKTVTLVGDGELAAIQLCLLEKWLAHSGHELNIVTHQSSAFEKFLADKTQSIGLKTKVRSIITQYMKDWRIECENIEKEILKWRELDPHEKAKIPRPEFPDPKVKLYEGYTITSVDKLTDRDQLFLTLELPAWKNRDNDRKELITLAQDCALVCTGFEKDDDALKSIKKREVEPGFMELDWEGKSLNPTQGLELVKICIDEIFTFFSKG